MMQKRDAGGKFIKGTSGNPSGRPATPEDVKTMLKCATAPAVQLLIDTMNDVNTRPDLRVRCAELVLDRVLGKSVQPLEAVFSTPSLDMTEFTVDELKKLAALDDGGKNEPEKPENSASGEE